MKEYTIAKLKEPLVGELNPQTAQCSTTAQVSCHAHNAISMEKEKSQLLQISNIIMN
jgi:hypothetical protein